MEGMVRAVLSFYRNKRVFVTGHTGFKGSWLCAILSMAGAEVTGYALSAEELSLCRIIGLERQIHSVQGDIRDLDCLWQAFHEAKPEIVFHLAAQPIVRKSYIDPVGTYQTNIMGTVHILECIHRSDCVRSFLNVTTDKVYENHQWFWGYRETDKLNGYDPYANSKSCSELVTSAYQKSFFSNRALAISTARAGNVIGGGDFSADRIIPDCIRAVLKDLPVQVRNPNSIRPYQHVLEPLSAYLLIAQRQYEDRCLAGCYNVGPNQNDCLMTSELVECFCQAWGENARWEAVAADGPHEDVTLKLDCAKIQFVLGWRPQWDVKQAVLETVAWTKAWRDNQDPRSKLEKQVAAFFGS